MIPSIYLHCCCSKGLPQGCFPIDWHLCSSAPVQSYGKFKKIFNIKSLRLRKKETSLLLNYYHYNAQESFKKYILFSDQQNKRYIFFRLKEAPTLPGTIANTLCMVGYSRSVLGKGEEVRERGVAGNVRQAISFKSSSTSNTETFTIISTRQYSQSEKLKHLTKFEPVNIFNQKNCNT